MLLKSVAEMPVVTLMGPRQAGKTTLARSVLPGWTYVNLEQLDHRTHATEDPLGFLDHHGRQVIIDEVQHAPDLLSYIQVRVDEQGGNGHYVLTGSHNLMLLRQVSQSLAGRTYIQELLPLSAAELHGAGLLPDDVDHWIFRGGYPRLYEQQRDPAPWLLSYIQTYVERDVRQVIDLRHVGLFSKFIQIAAGRIGQLWNQASVATEVGVDAMTINSWMSVLETSYIVFKLQPHYENFSKRLVKSPKLYFTDTGLACALLGLQGPEELALHWARGALFENALIVDRLKALRNAGRRPNLYFWRDSHGLEVDLLEDGPTRRLTEIKSSTTTTASMFTSLRKYRALYPREAECTVVYAGTDGAPRDEVRVLNWKSYVLETLNSTRSV